MTMTAAKPAPPFAGTHPQVNPEPTPGLTPAIPQAAIEAALAALALETQERLAEIPGRLQAMIARAQRGNPDKRDQRKRDAQTWADTQETLILQSKSDREAEILTGQRAAELEALEALRGGSVRTEVRDVETVILKNGAPVWYRGRKSTKRERITRTRVSRDGLESLARSHIGADGEVRTYPDGKPYTPAIGPILLAGALRYRRLFEDTDPEKGLKAVNPSAGGGGRSELKPWDSAMATSIDRQKEAIETIRRIEQEVQADITAALGRKPGQKAVWLLREIAGKGSTVYALVGSGGPATRTITLFETTLACLAARFGLL